MVSTTRSTMNDLANMLTYEGAEAKLKAESTTAPVSAKQKAELIAYAADRFNKARHVLLLMEEKLPSKACPYSVHMGYSIAQTWEFLSEYSGNKADKERFLKFLEQETEHVGQYVRFYQSLDSSLYSRLTLNDRYVDQRLFPEMLYYMSQVSEPRSKAVINKLMKQGVNIERSLNFLYQAQQQQSDAQVQAAEPDEVAADSTGL